MVSFGLLLLRLTEFIYNPNSFCYILGSLMPYRVVGYWPFSSNFLMIKYIFVMTVLTKIFFDF